MKIANSIVNYDIKSIQTNNNYSNKVNRYNTLNIQSDNFIKTIPTESTTQTTNSKTISFGYNIPQKEIDKLREKIGIISNPIEILKKLGVTVYKVHGTNKFAISHYNANYLEALKIDDSNFLNKVVTIFGDADFGGSKIRKIPVQEIKGSCYIPEGCAVEDTGELTTIGKDFFVQKDINIAKIKTVGGDFSSYNNLKSTGSIREVKGQVNLSNNSSIEALPNLYWCKVFIIPNTPNLTIEGKSLKDIPNVKFGDHPNNYFNSIPYITENEKGYLLRNREVSEGCSNLCKSPNTIYYDIINLINKILYS